MYGESISTTCRWNIQNICWFENKWLLSIPIRNTKLIQNNYHQNNIRIGNFVFSSSSNTVRRYHKSVIMIKYDWQLNVNLWISLSFNILFEFRLQQRDHKSLSLLIDIWSFEHKEITIQKSLSEFWIHHPKYLSDVCTIWVLPCVRVTYLLIIITNQDDYWFIKFQIKSLKYGVISFQLSHRQFDHTCVHQIIYKWKL